jgi:hypothetical protein
MAAELNALIRGQISLADLQPQTNPIPAHLEGENCDW